MKEQKLLDSYSEWLDPKSEIEHTRKTRLDKGAQNEVFNHEAALASSPVNFLLPPRPAVNAGNKKNPDANILMLLPQVASEIVEQQNIIYRNAINVEPTSNILPVAHVEKKAKHSKYSAFSDQVC